MSRIKISQHTDANGKQNEDSATFIRQGDRAILCIADGVGGLDAGEIASKYITKYVEIWSQDKNANEMGPKTTLRELGDLFYKLHDDLLAIGEEKDLHLGTTFIIAIVGEKMVMIASAGDSRVYICQKGKCTQVTIDQTVDEYEKETGEYIPNVDESKKSSTLMEWLGHGKEIPNPKVYTREIDEHVDILLCTDGLSNTVTEKDILSELRKKQGGPKALETLTSLAKERGETDNITSVLYRRRPDKKKKR